MFYNFIAKYYKQPTPISIKKRLNQLWFLLNGVLSSCQGMRQLSQVLIERLPRFGTPRGGLELVKNRVYNVSLFVERQIKEPILNVYTNICYIWKDTSKELVILVTEEIRVQWGIGERYISIPHLSVSTESSTVCLSHKLVG